MCVQLCEREGEGEGVGGPLGVGACHSFLRRDYGFRSMSLCLCLHFWSCCILMLAVANAQLSCNCEHERNLRDTSASMCIYICIYVSVCVRVWFSNFELHVLGVHSCRHTHTHTYKYTHTCNYILQLNTRNFNFSQTHILVTGAGNQLLIAHTQIHTHTDN